MTKNMKKEEFRCYMLKARMLYEKFSKTHLMRKYQISLSDGNFIKFQFIENHFPHLLGICIQPLRKYGILPQKLSSVEAMKLLFNSPDYYYEYIMEKGYDMEIFFSNYYKQKLDSLDNMPDFVAKNINFICHYDETKATIISDHVKSNMEYLLGFKNDNMYRIICLAKNQQDGHYFPLSNCYESEMGLNQVIGYQDLVMPVSIRTEDLKGNIIKNSFLNVKDKRVYIHIYEQLLEKYRCTINLTKAYKDLELNNRNIQKTVIQYQKDNQGLVGENSQLVMRLRDMEDELKKYRKYFAEKIDIVEEKDRTLKEIQVETPINRLKGDIFGKSDNIGMAICDKHILKAIQALTPEEKELICNFYGLFGRDKTTMSALARRYNVAPPYLNYKFKLIWKSLKTIYQGILVENPYVMLLTDREKLKAEIFRLPEEQRNIMLLRHGLFTCERQNNKHIAEALHIKAIAIPKLEKTAIDALGKNCDKIKVKK